MDVRPARLTDRAGPALLHASAQPYYDAFTGSGQRSARLLERLWPTQGHTAGHDACRVAVAGDEAAGILVAFRAEDGDALARRFLAAAFPRLPVWHWPHVIRHLRASGEIMPIPPAESLYVDALAVDRAHRRRGVATALLEDAERIASTRGLRGVSLDTGLENRAAQALYEAYGFAAHGERRASDPRVAHAVGGAGFVSYFKPL